MTARIRALTIALALVFLVIHLRYLPHSLEDIDTINFALGVESFDVTSHQPHPPGYPVFVAAGKGSTSLVGLLHREWDRDRQAAVGLAIWGVAAGTVAAWLLVAFWSAVRFPPGLAWVATLLCMSAPLFWITAARPLTDVPAFIAALGVQTWLLRNWRPSMTRHQPLPREWIFAALGAGLLVGVRSQTMWLTGPMLGAAFGMLVRQWRWRDALLLAVSAAVGSLLWAVPLVWVTGDFTKYLTALTAQGAEDFDGISMLATTFTPRSLRAALVHTFIDPWMLPVVGYTVTALACAGVLRLAWRDRVVLAALVLGFGPYLLFHLAFHETATVRYALPVVIPMAGLAIAGLQIAGRYTAVAGGVALALVCLVSTQPMLEAYAVDRAPAFRALRNVREAMPASEPGPMLVTHGGLRRAVDWYRTEWDIGSQPVPREREWLRLISHWRGGEQRPAWLLADRTRSDVALFDWRSRRLMRQFLRPPNLLKLVGGNRLEEVSWWEICRPAWMLGRGWALTPEIAGVTFADGREPQIQPAEAYLDRDPRAHLLMIGGRYLDGSGAGVIVLAIDGVEVARLSVAVGAPGFLEWVKLDAGTLEGHGAYATLTARIEAAEPGYGVPRVSFEQFDVAPAGAFMYGLGQGWLEAEEDRPTMRSWRWASEVNEIVVQGDGGDLSLVLAGESPLRYFDRAPVVRVRAGNREIARFRPDDDFEEIVIIPRAAIPVSPAVITIETDATFIPADAGTSGDRRHLGLRMYRVEMGER